MIVSRASQSTSGGYQGGPRMPGSPDSDQRQEHLDDLDAAAVAYAHRWRSAGDGSG
jgi:hypothetical protein